MGVAEIIRISKVVRLDGDWFDVWYFFFQYYRVCTNAMVCIDVRSVLTLIQLVVCTMRIWGYRLGSAVGVVCHLALVVIKAPSLCQTTAACSLVRLFWLSLCSHT